MTVRKRTRQQQAVVAALDGTSDFLSAQQLHALLRESGASVGLATVYRALAGLAADGSVDVLRTDDGEALYRRCSRSHHHHLICRECGRTLEVTGAGVETWAARTAREHGFRDVEHTMEVFGVCPRC